jgi:hypothetical protein
VIAGAIIVIASVTIVIASVIIVIASVTIVIASVIIVIAAAITIGEGVVLASDQASQAHPELRATRANARARAPSVPVLKPARAGA